jgi:hypothetical protein
LIFANDTCNANFFRMSICGACGSRLHWSFGLYKLVRN